MIVIPANSPEHWQATTWSHIVGNRELKEILLEMVHNVRVMRTMHTFRAFVYGPSRGGKTSTINFAIKCLLCNQLDFETLNPCHACTNCRKNVQLYGNHGWEDYVDPSEEGERSTRFLYIPVDCTRVTASQMDDIFFSLSGKPDRLQIAYYDEVHRLSRSQMDERLLIEMERMQAIVLASSAVRGTLDEMLMNRFDERIEVELPTVYELAVFLAERCEEWGIRVDEPEGTLSRAAQRSNQVPGMALQVLRRAHRSREKLLTKKMVEEFRFVAED